MNYAPVATWSATLASNLAHVGAHWAACTRAADVQVTDLLRSVAREWCVMVKDVRFTLYGGVDTPDRRAAYTARRVSDTRRRLSAYLHRPECRAFAEALDAATPLVPDA